MKYTHAAIIPLIGFQSLAVDSVFGKRPEYILTYEAFAANEKHIVEHYQDVPYHVIDAATNTLDAEIQKVDVVHAVCPCAALSPLNSGKAKGEDAPQNDWMYMSTEFVLKNVQPQVMFGENAIRLGTPSGRKVADKLYEIGKLHGYSFTIYCTEARRHASPQKRPRTFYAFIKGDQVPQFKRYNNASANIADLLNAPKPTNDPMDILMNKDTPSENGWIAYAMHKANAMSFKELASGLTDSLCITTYAADESGNYVEAADWFDEHGYDSIAKRCRAIQAKIDDNKSFWGHGMYVPGGNQCHAFVGTKPTMMTHPTEDRFLTVREGLRMMGVPDDFNMTGNVMKQLNMMCQNVTFSAAKDFATEVFETLEGNRAMIDSNYAVQSNINGKLDDRKTRSLTDVFGSI